MFVAQNCEGLREKIAKFNPVTCYFLICNRAIESNTPKTEAYSINGIVYYVELGQKRCNPEMEQLAHKQYC